MQWLHYYPNNIYRQPWCFFVYVYEDLKIAYLKKTWTIGNRDITYYGSFIVRRYKADRA